MQKKIAILCFLFMIVLGSCNNTKKEIMPDESSLSEVSQGILAFLDVKEANEVLNFFRVNGKLDWNVTTEITDLKSVPKHDYTSTSKYEFARWADSQLISGKCLKVGRTGNTYWADFTA
jgi:hypothetical protein